jgi:hypothetical protein
MHRHVMMDCASNTHVIGVLSPDGPAHAGSSKPTNDTPPTATAIAARRNTLAHLACGIRNARLRLPCVPKRHTHGDVNMSDLHV